MKFFPKIKLPKNRLFFFSSIILCLWLLTQIPYISLFISPILILFFAYVTAIVLFKISPKVTVIISLFLILSSFPWVLIGSRVHAQAFGIGSFLLFTIAFLQIAWDTRKDQ